MNVGAKRKGRTASVQDPEQLVLLAAPTPRRKRKPKRGRPKQARAGARHAVRPSLSKHHPVHVVLRVVEAIGSLRRRQMFRAIREATICSFPREDFRIVHVSVQRTHIHLLVEAEDRRALWRGMQSFQISAAKHLNAMVSKVGPRRRGTVFPDRYHAEVIDSPRQARHALAYVLNNWRKHTEDRKDPRIKDWNHDWFSSAWTFTGWAELADEHVLHLPPPTYESLLVRKPSTWLLRDGWKRHGLISYREVPSSK
jgi:putative transposase